MNTHFLRATLAALAGLLLVAVGAQAQPVLQNSSISPSTTTSPVGQSQLFTTTWYDSWGPGDFSYFYLNINLYGTYAGGGCLVAGQVNGSYLYLANDAGTAYMGPIQAGSGTLSNSRCTLSGSGSSVSVNGTTGTMVVNLTPTAAFVGTQPLWLWESGNSGYSSPHEQKGTWTIASNSGTDLALNQAATQSSTYPDNPMPTASLAVDGNTDGSYYDHSVSHTNNDWYAWWQVDLGSSYTVNSVVIWNRIDCCGSRLADYWVFISNTPFQPTDTPATLQSRAGTLAFHQTSAPNPSTTISPGYAGRYVRVQLSGQNYLALAEVQVYGTAGTLPPPPVTLSSPSNNAPGQSTSPTLSWTASSGATSYDVYLGTGFPPPLYRNTTSTSLTPSPNLNGGTTYYWNVVAKNSAGSSSASDTWSFSTVQLPTQTITTTPSGLQITVDSVGYTSPHTFQWTAGSVHTIATPAAQTANGAQYLFSNWSDGTPLTHSISAPASPATYTAAFAQRLAITGGISPARLEVNLGPIPFDKYDGTTLNGNTLPQCNNSNGSGWVLQACMEWFLSKYAIQGVTGVRFQFATRSSPSTAFDGSGNVQSNWVQHLSSFFADLAAFGINNITPTPSWDDFSSPAPGVLSGPICAPYATAPGCPTLEDSFHPGGNCTVAPNAPDPNCPIPASQQSTLCQIGTGSNAVLGKMLNFTPLLPYALDPADGNDPDGRLDIGNAGYVCSPPNSGRTDAYVFWGWSKHYSLINSIAAAASGAHLNIEEFDLDNEVDMVNQNHTGTPYLRQYYHDASLQLPGAGFVQPWLQRHVADGVRGYSAAGVSRQHLQHDLRGRRPVTVVY